MILQKVQFIEKGRNAVTVDDFYYRGYEEKLNGRKGTGTRNLAADFIKQGKILDRILMLKENGSILEIQTVFRSKADLLEFNEHPINIKAKKFWEDRKWDQIVEIIHIEDYLNVKTKTDLKSVL